MSRGSAVSSLGLVVLFAGCRFPELPVIGEDAGDAATVGEETAGASSKPSACPADMKLVDGDYCSEVEHKCLKKWYDKSNKKVICEEFAPTAKCTGTKAKKRYCIDTYEWPNQAGATPVVMKTWYEAKAACGGYDGRGVSVVEPGNYDSEIAMTRDVRGGLRVRFDKTERKVISLWAETGAGIPYAIHTQSRWSRFAPVEVPSFWTPTAQNLPLDERAQTASDPDGWNRLCLLADTVGAIEATVVAGDRVTRAERALVIDKGQIVYRDTIDKLKANDEIRRKYLAM